MITYQLVLARLIGGIGFSRGDSCVFCLRILGPSIHIQCYNELHVILRADFNDSIHAYHN